MRFPRPAAGPVLVVDADADRWRPSAQAAGWRVIDADAVPDEPWLLRGTLVRTGDPAVAALTLARGGGAALTTSDGGQLMADARRLGASVWPDDAAATVDEDADETDVLMEQLAAGRSVAAAARAAHVSLRTAQRRLAVLRRKHGVRTTAGVVSAWTKERRS